MRVRSIKYKSRTNSVVESKNKTTSVHVKNQTLNLLKSMNNTLSITRNIETNPNQTTNMRQLDQIKVNQNKINEMEANKNEANKDEANEDIANENKANLKFNLKNIANRNNYFPIQSFYCTYGQDKANFSKKINLKCLTVNNSNILQDFKKQNKFMIFNTQIQSQYKHNFNNTQNKENLLLRISKFAAQNKTLEAQPSQTLIQNQKIISEKEEIYFAENLTFNVQILENTFVLLQKQIKSQKNKIEKIKRDLKNLSSKIENQFQTITKDYNKEVQNLSNLISRAKAQKCTILINWKSVIIEKNDQYQLSGAFMTQIFECADKIKQTIEGKKANKQTFLDCSTKQGLLEKVDFNQLNN